MEFKEKKYENDHNEIFSSSTIEKSVKTFIDTINIQIPNILIPSVSKKDLNLIILKRHFLPYNLHSYLKMKPLLIERTWIGYQILNTLNLIHEKKLLHLNLKPSNILLNDMGIPFVCDMGFHLENLKLIEKTNRIYIDSYLKLIGEDSKYLDPNRLVDRKRTSILLQSATTYVNENVFSSFDVYPLLIILQDDLNLPNEFINSLKEEYDKIECKDSRWELTTKLKNKYEKNFELNYKFFTDLNKEIINRSSDFHYLLIEYYFIYWEEVWRKLIINFKNDHVFTLKIKIDTKLVKNNIERTETKKDIHILFLNYLIPSIFYCNDALYRMLGLEMMEKLILSFLEQNNKETENLIYIAERIFPFLINLFSDENNNIILRKTSLNLFFLITKQCDFSLITEYEEYQIINYIIIKLQDIFKISANEFLISFVVDNIEVVINLITQFKHLSMKLIYENHLKHKLNNHITETSFFGNDVADIEKSIRIYEDKLKERQIELFIQNIIEQILIFDIQNLRVALIRNLPKLSPYFKKEYYLFVVKSLFDNRNNHTIIELIKILDNILLYDEKGDIVDLILENLKMNVNQAKLKELLEQIMNLYDQGFLEEYPLIEVKLITGPDNVFNFIWIAKGSSLAKFKLLISYMIKNNLPIFYSKVQKFIIPYFTKEQDEFLLTEKDLENYTDKTSKRSSEQRLTVSSSSSVSFSSVYVRNLLDITKITFTIHDFAHQTIIQLFEFEKYIIVYCEKDNKGFLSVLKVIKDRIFKYQCEQFNTINLDRFPPNLDPNLCFFEKGIFYYLKENTNDLVRLDIFNTIDFKKYELIKDISEPLLFLIKLINTDNIMIVTKSNLNVYSIETLKRESEKTLSPINGKIMCYDYTKEFKQIIFGTNLGHLYIYDVKNNEIKGIQINNFNLPIINLKTTLPEGLHPCILIQFKTKMLNVIDSFILSDNPILNNKFFITKNNKKEEVSFDINTICSEFEHTKIFFSGGKDLIYWDFNPSDIKEKSRNLSDIYSEKQVESIKHLQGFSSAITVHESVMNNHTFIKKIVAFKEDSSNILFTVHVDGTISLWS